MSGEAKDKWTVARYLSARLVELGVTDLFGVPGNHLGPFLPVVRKAGIRWVGTCNEINGGYAADGYARATRRMGAVAVTYGVGALSVIQPVGGAYVEEIPLVVITGAPTYEQWLNLRAIGLLTSHMSPKTSSNVDAFRQVTVDAQVLTSSRMAPVQIDAALTACLTERRPVYLEVWENVWDGECDAPVGTLQARPRPTTAANDSMRAKAVAAAVELIKKRGQPILWAGEEIDRYGLRAEFESLVEATGLGFCTTIGGKSVISENHPKFNGVYNGKASLLKVYEMFQAAGCRVGLGSWPTSKNLGGTRSVGDDWIVAAHQGVSVGAQYFPDIKLGEFMKDLSEALVQQCLTATRAEDSVDYYRAVGSSREEFIAGLSATHPGDKRLTYDGFIQRISAFLDEAASGQGTAATSPYVVVSDAGFSLLSSQNLKMPEPRSYFCQGSWLAIGYSVGAALGIKVARPEKRPLVFVGDGSFQETCQELSTLARLRHDSVVFVMNNGDFYGIEQMLVHPCYYDPCSSEEASFYNKLHPWNYTRLADVFSGPGTPVTGVEVGTYGELDALLRRLADKAEPANHGPILVQVRLPQEDYPCAIHYEVEEKCGKAKP
jgi:TPP-dependent 2-oxoacid decarboxylase